MFQKKALRLSLPIPWLVTLAVALVALWLLIHTYGMTGPVLIGWLVAWLVVSRAVNWFVARNRKALRSGGPGTDGEASGDGQP